MTDGPYVCPRCEGERTVYDGRSGGTRNCPTCDGRGVVFRDGPEEAHAAGEPEDVRDLTFRR